MNTTTPYANLDPHLILNAIEHAGFACSGGLTSLNSYENRVYQVGIEEGPPLIAKFYRPERWSNDTILEEHQFSKELVEHEIPVVAPFEHDHLTLHTYKDFRFALFPRLGGWALELDQLDQLAWMGRFIGRMHAVGACRPFKHRLALNVENFGRKPTQFLIENNFLPSHLKKNYYQTAEKALQLIADIFSRISPLKSIRLHGDIHPGNVLWNTEGPHIVDLDDCVMGPAIQDIWMLLSGCEREMNIQIDEIISGYNEFHDFNFRELILIEPLRTLRILHYSGWLAKRWEDPAFPRSFPWFNTPAYWEEQLSILKDQIVLLEKC